VRGDNASMRIGILVVAYNAVTTLSRVLDRIPADVVDDIAEILVQDDASADDTYLVALGYQNRASSLPLTVVRHEANLGYGGNQKAGYRYAIDHGWDVVVLLHGDGQYPPELLRAITEPIVNGEADAVMGSRMMMPGEARKGGMPLYKYVGNRILTRFQNAVAGLQLTEWHSGYRAYRVASLAGIPFEANSDGFDFDTEILLQLHDAGRRIKEIPIPTYYGDEICYVNGLGYAKDVVVDTLRYRVEKAGFGRGELGHVSGGDAYRWKPDDASSHGRILSWLRGRPKRRILDVGCSAGWLAASLRDEGHEVDAVDLVEIDGVRERVDRFVRADLDEGLPAEITGAYDTIIAADVLEHVRDPDRLLASLRDHLAPGGSILVSVPNFGHWYPRTRTALGAFDYDQRGILDGTHLRFFTRASFHRLVRRSGLRMEREEFTGLPLDAMADGQPGRASRGRRAVAVLDQLSVHVRPELFAYQFLAELVPADR
jgi:glycosyltransferase involved in cell wall biosynthesis